MDASGGCLYNCIKAVSTVAKQNKTVWRCYSLNHWRAHNAVLSFARWHRCCSTHWETNIVSSVS